MEAIVFTIFQIFYAMHAVLKIGGYKSDVSQFWLGHIELQPRNAFRPIAFEQIKVFDRLHCMSAIYWIVTYLMYYLSFEWLV